MDSGESEAGRCAKEIEREEGSGLNIAPCGAPPNDGDRDRRNNQPERRQNLDDETGGSRRHERREHHERDAENRDGFAGAWHGVQATNILPVRLVSLAVWPPGFLDRA